ncbi:MAG: ComEC/Rec2 family competence protein [Bifidobacterium sp.]|uniref:ComEC/Rec2 family competence protein n=1 Tax=Bifidobacterium sp. TaxID=41200 RepID=UPI003F126096
MSRTSTGVRLDGRRDLRLLPVAIAMWAGELAASAVCNRANPASGASPDAPAWSASMMPALPVAFPVGLALLAAMMYARRSLARIIRAAWRGMVPAGAGIVLLVMVLTASGAGILVSSAHQRTQQRDPAMRIAQQTSASRLSTLEMRIDTPMTASSRRGADCQADVTILGVHEAARVTPSHASARLFANGDTCASLDHGMQIRTQASVSPAAFGSRPLWVGNLTHTGITRVPQPARSLANRMRHSFAAVTARLSDQGRILVPGLTCGLLGQDYIGPGSLEQPDTTYAARVEQEFRTSGIMHLMAVSGGHFILVAQLAQWLGAAIRLPRPIAAIGVIATYQGLAILVYPSDSVLRAQIMGTFSAIGMLLGRPPQTASALAWTTIMVLALAPGKSASYGYALSSAAVLGITLCTPPLQRRLDRRLPHTASQAVATTLSAQIFTLPIQILMEPQIPLLSVLANLMVAPFVSWATVTGLIALMLAPFVPAVAFAAAWLASCGTAIMALTAHVCAAPAWTALAWPSGIQGALLALAVQAVIALLPGIFRSGANAIGDRAIRYGRVRTGREQPRREPYRTFATAGHAQRPHPTIACNSRAGCTPVGRPWRACGKIRTWLAETRAMIDDRWHRRNR